MTEQTEIKYSLVISQYYHSRHMFIVKVEDNFLTQARAFSEELMKYKRDADNERPLYLGDLDPEYSDNKPIRHRYNINDAGDIYFIQAKYTNYCMDCAFEYRDTSRRELQGFKSNKVKNAISEHHDIKQVTEILKKYFEIA